MRRDYEKSMPNLKITRSSQPQQFDHTAIMASRPQCERWRKTSHPCVVEAKTPDTPGGGRFRLQLRYTRRKGDRSVKKMSKRFQTREEALAAAPGMREDWEDRGGKPIDPSMASPAASSTSVAAAASTSAVLPPG